VRVPLLPPKAELPLADDEIAAVHNLGKDIYAVCKIEVGEIPLAVFNFVDGRSLASRALDVGERVVAIDRGDKKLSRALRFEVEIEL
jgi:hypothetical protein